MPTASNSLKMPAKSFEFRIGPLSIVTVGDDPTQWDSLHQRLQIISGEEIEFLDRNSLSRLLDGRPMPHIFLVLVPLQGGALPVIQTLRSNAPESRIVIFSDENHITAQSLMASFAAGAHAWLPISISDEALTRSLEAVHDGELGLSRRHMSMVLSALHTPQEPTLHLGGAGIVLTPRERQVLSAVSKSQSTHQISQTLGMSPGTVRWHIGALMKKLQVSTRAELARHRSDAQPAFAAAELAPSLALIPSPRIAPEETPTLSEGELKVARKVAQGLTNREIAACLFISTHTVNSHLKRAYTKLGIRSRVELARIVVVQEPSTPHRRYSAVS